ncbi:hypothetical protein SAMN05216413_1416 [Ruminococcaceae bacterium KH2T8]|nr:hypothetical protein SAMN05216413_1416 [Ruminococcaceae bacterium KH2T8]
MSEENENKIFDIPATDSISEAAKAAEGSVSAVKEEVKAVTHEPLIAPPPVSLNEAKAPLDAAVMAAKGESAEAIAAAAAKPNVVSEKEAKASQKAAAKAEKAAAKAEAANAKMAEKEAAKEAKKQAKLDAKKAKNAEKAAAEQAKIDACPQEYTPVSTSKFFWYGFISFIPVVGLLFAIFMSIGPRNKNIKNFERAILIAFVIEFILTLIALIIMVFVNGSSVSGIIEAFAYFFEELASA